LLKEALAMVQSEAFDIVLSDLGLPDSTGTEAIDQLHRVAPFVPVIVMSGQDDEAIAVQAVQQGAQDYLIKGQVDSDVLVRAIRYAVERKKAERKLQETEQNYRIIFDNSAVAIMMVNDVGQLISWNQFAANLLEMTEEDLYLRPIKTFYPKEEWAKICEQDISLKGMQHHLETRMIKKTGGIIDIDISLTVLKDPTGRVTGSIGVIRDISERKEAEGELERSYALLNATLESTADGLLAVDNAGQLASHNEKFSDMWGFTKASLTGKSYHDVVIAMGKQLTEGDAFLVDLENAIKLDNTGMLEKNGTLNFKDGRIIEYYSKPRTVSKHVTARVFSFRDVTERKRVHEILERKQENLEAIFDAAPIGMLLVDSKLKVCRANDSVRAMVHKEYKDIIGHRPGRALGCVSSCEFPKNKSWRCGDTKACLNCQFFDTISHSLNHDKAVHGVELNPHLRIDGKELHPWLSISTESLSIDGERFVVVAVNDITERVRAERELRETMEIKSQFVSTVSHELRTPLASMKESVLIVLDGVAGPINQDQTHFLDVARRNIDRLWRLIDDVLDFQKLGAGKMTFKMNEGDLIRTVEEAYSTLRQMARKGSVDLTLDVQRDAPLAVYDADRLIQVLTNLMSNAIKFTPENGRVTVAAKCVGQEFVLTIKDTGLGIPKEDLSKVFERFYRVNRPGREITGTGLGLAIVRRIIDAHSGRIDVQSTVGEGTTFVIYLPVKSQLGTCVLRDVEDQTVETMIQAN
ncbi:MAG: PAS domain S-box protein, partial [Planctomycetes bacterium]|nr:PAS domain S-box protein [Planctomycetota bacterium]